MVIFHSKVDHRSTLIWLHDVDDCDHAFGSIFVDPEGKFDLPEGMKVILP
jgi:hypothetical protein